MTTTAENLRDLHALHQRANALRDRLESGPKTVETRRSLFARRKADLEAGLESLKHDKGQIKSKETQSQSIHARVADLRSKLNATKKQAEYDAIRNQIAAENLAASKLEDEALELMSRVETVESELKTRGADVAKLGTEVEALAAEVEAKAEGQRTQLAALEAAILEAENVIPADVRDQYLRVVKGRGADGMAPAESRACTGCNVTVTHQMLNELINGESLVFCKSCGRILYLPESELDSARRGKR